MSRHSVIPTMLAALWLAAAGASAALGAQARYEVTVSAPETAYRDTPVWIPLDAPGELQSARMRQADGAPIECQVVRDAQRARVVFVLADLPQGESRRYDLTLTDRPAPTYARGVEMKQDAEAVVMTAGGDLFTRYNFGNAPKPFCYPVIGPGGAPLTRNYPMQAVPGESSDHPHHRSLWFTHGDVNGVDFWSESDEAGRIVHRGMESGGSGRALGWLRARHDWLDPDGRKVCEGLLELRLYSVSRGRLMDFSYTVAASEGPVKFGDTKEGTFGLRVADSMTVKGGQGHILNSEGQRDGDAWGKRAAWCDYSGPVQGQPVGITIFDHPDNLRHPTYWHVRDYGLFAANPFGVHDFTGQPGEPGAYVLPQGEKLVLRYRIYVHDGAPDPAALAALYEQYAYPPQVSVRPAE